MVIPIEPVAFAADAIAFRWIGIIWLAAAGLGMALWAREAGRRGVSTDQAVDILTWVVPAAMLGARLAHVLSNLDYYALHPREAVGPASGSFALWGALIGGGLAVIAVARARGLPATVLGDAAAPALALGEAVGRIGCFLDGSSLGAPAELPWSVGYARDGAAPLGQVTMRHPAQVYHALAALGTYRLVCRLAAGRPAQGAVFAVWLALQSLARFTIGFFRVDRPLLLGLQDGQWWALVALVGLGAIIWRRRWDGRVAGAGDVRESHGER